MWHCASGPFKNSKSEFGVVDPQSEVKAIDHYILDCYTSNLIGKE
jgi:hypothetical protein